MLSRVFVVTIGSNLERERNLASAIEALLGLADPLHLSRIVETAPVGIVDGGGPFLNLAAAFDWSGGGDSLKERLIAIEVWLGRDRRDPERASKSRTADIDLVLELAAGEPIASSALPSEPYARVVVLDLLRHLGLAAGEPAPLPETGVELLVRSVPVGRRAATLTRAALAGAELGRAARG
jgi:2-amino-4-hydroxy-6-hydroxymethyldihydropteridine diphosphokinase